MGVQEIPHLEVLREPSLAMRLGVWLEVSYDTFDQEGDAGCCRNQDVRRDDRQFTQRVGKVTP